MQLSERSLNMEVKGLYSGFSDHQIRLGAGTMWQDLYSVQHSTTDPANRLSLIDISDTPAAFVPEKLRKIHYLFAQDVWTLSHAWSLTAGVRYDHYSDFGGAMNPRFALVWQSSDKLTSKLLYGEGFRVPTFQELYCIKCGVRPNADLSSEKSANWDLSFVYSPSKKMQLGFGLFNLKLNNLIDEVSGQFYNAGNHTINGVELEAIWQATPALRVSANYSHRFQHEAGQSVLAPAQDAYVRMDWGFKPKWNWNMQVNWLSAHPRLAGDARPEIGAQSVADMTLRHSPRKNWELAASIRNIFDADLREYTGNALQDDLPLPGLNMHAEINYKFK
jgi:iron complex outermembrane receptor protein